MIKILRKNYYLLVLLLLAACSPSGQSAVPFATETRGPLPTTPVPLVETQEIPSSTTRPGDQPQAVPTNVRIEDDTDYYIPSMLPYDAIRPVYYPTFSPANTDLLQDDELVMGVAIAGEAKAYPVSVLRFREMVNDELAGWPVLVTW